MKLSRERLQNLQIKPKYLDFLFLIDSIDHCTHGKKLKVASNIWQKSISNPYKITSSRYKPLIYEGVAAVYMYKKKKNQITKKDNWPYQLANK